MQQPLYKSLLLFCLLFSEILSAQSYKIELIKDIDTAFAKSGVSQTTIMSNYGDKLYFSGRTPASGSELWVTDGTAGGTKLVTEIYPGTIGSNPTTLYVHNNILYFAATSSSGKREFWRTDGTELGDIQRKKYQYYLDGYIQK